LRFFVAKTQHELVKKSQPELAKTVDQY